MTATRWASYGEPTGEVPVPVGRFLEVVMALPAARVDPMPVSRLAVPAWFLVTQVLLWIPAVAIVLSVPDLPLEPTASWTEGTQDDVRGAWIAHQLVSVGAFLAGLGALALLARRIGTGGARWWVRLSIACVVVAGVLAVVYAALRLGMLATAAPTLADVATYRAADVVARVLDAVTLVATASGGLALWRAGLASRTGPVVAALSVLLIPVGLLKPPFVYGLLLLPLGVALLREVRARQEVPRSPSVGAVPGTES